MSLGVNYSINEANVSSKDLVGYYYSKIAKSLRYLEYTYKRIENLPSNPELLTSEQLETWDSFAVRFARTSDLFLSKFITAVIKRDDPAFDGGFRDKLHQAEKLGLIDNVSTWMEIRQLRNVTVHEYSDEDLKEIFRKIKAFTPLLLELEVKLSPLLRPL
jgi:hypothetical protein